MEKVRRGMNDGEKRHDTVNSKDGWLEDLKRLEIEKRYKMKREIIKSFLVILVAGVTTSCSAKNDMGEEAQDVTYAQISDISESSSANKNNQYSEDRAEKANLYEEYKDYPIYSKEFTYYLLNSDIYDFPDFSDRIAKLEKDLQTADTEKMYVYESGFGGDTGFKHAPDKTEYIYVGEVKDGQPHGIGKVVHTYGSEAWTLRDRFGDISVIVYEGYFDKGRCDGFGISYASALDDNIGYVMEEIVRNYNSEFDKYVHLYYTPIEYIGDYDKGERKGIGAWFSYPEDERGEYLLGKYSLRDIDIDTGEFKKNAIVKGKSYFLGHLLYEGEYDKGNRNGEGRLYYLNSEALAFEGEFKKNEIVEGTLYFPDGNIVEKGTWKNGICGITDFNEIYYDNSELTEEDEINLLSELYDMEAEDVREMQEYWRMIEEGELVKEWEEEIIEERDWEREEYIIPDSDKRYLTDEDLQGMDESQLRFARNEIYARHGRSFQTPDLNNYFNSKSWYDGYIPMESFDDSVLNEYEKANLELIKSKEGEDNAGDKNTTLVSGLYEGDIEGNKIQISISLYSEFIKEGGMTNLGDFEIIVDDEHEWANIFYNNSGELIIMDMYGNEIGSAVIDGKDTLAVELFDIDILFTRIERY